MGIVFALVTFVSQAFDENFAVFQKTPSNVEILMMILSVTIHNSFFHESIVITFHSSLALPKHWAWE